METIMNSNHLLEQAQDKKSRMFNFNPSNSSSTFLETLDQDFDQSIISNFKELQEKIDVPTTQDQLVELDEVEQNVDRKISEMIDQVKKRSKLSEKREDLMHG